LLRLLDSDRVYVKLSAPYLASGERAGHADLENLVRSLVAVAPHRLLWGSNWPHTQGVHRNARSNPLEPEPFRVADDRLWLARCRQWAGAHANALLGKNAAALYGFTTPESGRASASC
jgi:predicted TIM-barrel fold metal-dependent hydrolase